MFSTHAACRAVVVLLLLLVSASPLRAAGGSPADPVQLPVGGAPLSVTISQPGEGVWVRAAFTPSSSVSHAVFETTGDNDTYLLLYKNLDDAQLDRPLAEDDDSGDDRNAKIAQPLGYSSPYYLKVRLYSASATGSFQLTARAVFQEPESCPFAGPCAMVAAAQGKPEAAGILATMRTIRAHLLNRTPVGREVIDLYYATSKEIVWELAAEPSFRQALLGHAAAALPALAETARVALGGGTGLTLSPEMIATARSLADLLAERVSAATAARLRTAYDKLDLERSGGRTIAEVLQRSGLLAGSSSRWVADPQTGRPVVAGEVLVKFGQSPPVAPSLVAGGLRTGIRAVDAAAARFATTAVSPVFAAAGPSPVGLDRVFKVRLADDGSVPDFLRDLLATGAVDYAVRNGEVSIQSDDVYFPYQYALENHEVPAADIRATEAWPLESGDPSVLVAVVDTGIDSDLADLAGRVRTDLDHDFVNDDDDAFDDHGHGTHVSGIIAASVGNRTSIAGVAPRVSLVGFKVIGADGTGTEEDVAAGIRRAIAVGADVINLSLGTPSFSAVIEDAVHDAHDHGVLVAAAAGNDGVDELLFPAASPYVLAVGATDSTNARTSFSNYGDGLDLMAPGDEVISLFPGGLSCYASGTSMATPHVAGVGALVRSRAGAVPLAAIEHSLLAGAHDLGAPGYDLGFGWGLVDAVAALGFFPPRPAGVCTPDAHTACLLGGRFQVRGTMQDFSSPPRQVEARVMSFPEQRAESAQAVFFDSFRQGNFEIGVKMVDACSLPADHPLRAFWVFTGGLTNAATELRIEDTVTGQLYEWSNGVGEFPLTLGDTGAFPCVAGTPTAPCSRSATTACLLGGRFAVSGTMRDFDSPPHEHPARVMSFPGGRAESTQAVFFDSFNPGNFELGVKMVDGCSLPVGDPLRSYWVFFGGLTNAASELEVTQMSTALTQSWSNPAGAFPRSEGRTGAFPCE